MNWETVGVTIYTVIVLGAFLGTPIYLYYRKSRMRRERRKFIDSFNDMARSAFTAGEIQFILKASISSGETEYKHGSSWSDTGFEIQVLNNGYQLSAEETAHIGQTYISDAAFARQLIALGWDTLIISNKGFGYKCKYIFNCKYKLTDYANIGPKTE